MSDIKLAVATIKIIKELANILDDGIIKQEIIINADFALRNLGYGQSAEGEKV